MNYRALPSIVIAAGVLANGMSASAQPPRTDVGQPAEQPAAPQLRQQVPQQTQAAAQADVSSHAVANWLIAELSQARSINQFAAERAQDQQVRVFAANSALAYGDLIQSLQRVAPDIRQAQAPAGEGDVSEELEEIAEQIQEEVREEPEGTAVRPAAEPPVDAAVDEARAVPAEQDVADRASRREDREGILRNRENGPLQSLRAAIAEARGREGTARERIREVLPALRESLPEVVDLLTEAVEEGTPQGSAAWLDWHRSLLKQQTQSIQEELARYEGEAFVQAYAGYEILEAQQLQDALELAQQTTGEELQPILQQGLETVQQQLREARMLMPQGDTARRGAED